MEEEDKIIQDNDDILLTTEGDQLKKKQKHRLIFGFIIIGLLVFIGLSAWLIYWLLSKDFEVLFENEAIMKSDVEKTKMTIKVIQLANKLNVTLVSDFSLKLAHAGMVIGSGFTLEGNVAGLAHFTEHMVFQGKNKDTYLQNYVFDHGGNTNAFTDASVVGYFFNVLSPSYEKGLEFFSLMLTKVDFDEESISKEISAVHSEFLMVSGDDDYRELELIGEQFDQNFTCGNFETLGHFTSSELNNKMKELIKREYYPQNANLFLQAPLSIRDLEKYAVKYFKNMRNQRKTQISKINPSKYFNKMCKIGWYKSLSSAIKLDYIFPIPHPREDFIKSPINFLLYLFNDKNQGSVYYDLKNDNNYITKSDYFILREDNLHLEIVIRLELTKKGFDNIELIHKKMFSYLNMLRNTHINGIIFNEFQRISKQNFTFSTTTDDMSILLMNLNKVKSNLAYAMHTAPWIDSEFDKETIQNYLNYFSLDNCLILLGNDNIENIFKISWKDYVDQVAEFEIPKVYPYYKILHNIMPIKSEKSNELKDIMEYGYTMKLNNKYASNALKPITCTGSTEECDKEKNTIESIQVINVKNCLLYMKLDRTYQSPKAYANFRFIHSYIRTTDPKLASYARFFYTYVTFALKDKLNDALISGNEFEITRTENGINLIINAYNDKLETMLTDVFRVILAPSFTQSEFESLMENLEFQKANSNLIDSLSLAETVSEQILKTNARTLFGEIKENYEEFRNTILHFSSSFLIDGIFIGVVNKEQIESFYENIIKNYLSPDPTIENELGTDNVVAYLTNHYPIKGSYVYRIKTPSIHEENHAINNLYYVGHGRNDANEYYKAKMIHKMWGNLFFDTLRTQWELGYTVNSKIHILDYKVYHCIYIQGDKKNPYHMDRLIDDVIEMGKKKLIDTTEESLDAYKKDLLVQSPKTLISKMNTIFGRITNRVLTFDEIDEERILNAITKKDLLDTYDATFYNAVRKLSVQIYINTPDVLPMQDEDYKLNKRIKTKVSGDMDILKNNQI